MDAWPAVVRLLLCSQNFRSTRDHPGFYVDEDRLHRSTFNQQFPVKWLLDVVTGTRAAT